MKKFKNVKWIGLFLSIILVVIVGCQKDPVVPEKNYNMSVTINGDGGIVYLNLKVVTSGESLKVLAGSQNTFSWKTEDGYALESLKINGTEKISSLSNNIYPINDIDGNCDIQFSFNKSVVSKYTIEASSSEGGSISPSGLIEVTKGSNLSLYIKPDQGFEGDSIIVDGVKSPLTIYNYDFSNIDSTHKVKVFFKKTALQLELELLIAKPWTLSKLEERNVGTTEWYSQSFSYETEIFIKVSYDSNYRFSVFDAKGNTSGSTPYTLTADSLIWGQPQGQHLSGGIRNKILILNENTLKMVSVAKYIYTPGDPPGMKDVEFQYTYIH